MKNIISITLLTFVLSACAGTQEKLSAFGNSIASGAAKLIPTKNSQQDASASQSGGAGTTHGMAMMMNNDQEKPIDYIPEALGNYTWEINTNEPMAQNYFNQGMQLRWAYNVNEAARSMAEARRIDPKCAICYWGEAFALGSFLNAHMTTEKGVLGRKAILTAAELAEGNASQMEQDLIEATVVRYPENWTTEMSRDKQARQPTYRAFADAMAEVYKKYPDNHEIAAVYAVSLFMLEERRGYRDLNSSSLIHLHNVLTGVLDEDITHPGACHLYIHATESTTEPGRAELCADHLSDAVPVASHIQHMPSHTYNEIGRWDKAVIANTKAQQSDLRAKENKGFSYGDSHNIHMLLYAASYDGQGSVAMQAGRDYRKITDMSPYEVLTQIRFGRFDDVLANDNKPKDAYSAAVWTFAKGYAQLKTGNIQAAKETHSKVLESHATMTGTFRGDSKKNLTEIVALILAGEIALTEGDTDEAILYFEKSVKMEDTLEFSEPEPLPFAARHWLGAALLQVGDYQGAERTYREELADHPHNGWSLFGLKEALVAQNIDDPAVNKDLEESWSRSNLWITSSRF
ncbi:MAG: hypothetical protein VX469_05965 [Pseudomonadota bacterium]|nr:hypothetical protein [Pseudomonadota bacterium]